MKIVINKCYVGFCLSGEALVALAERDAKCLKKLSVENYYGNDTYSSFDKDTAKAKKIGKYDVHDWDYWVHKDGVLYILDRLGDDSFRTDSDMIDVVEKMGRKANGRCAALAVIDIPDGIDYEIDEYDGIETVHEKHRSW